MAERKTRMWKVPDGEPATLENEQGEVFEVPPDLSLEELEAEMVGLAHTLYRIGGIVNVAADREQVAPGIYRTGQVVFAWESYVPAPAKQERVEVEEIPIEPQGDELPNDVPPDDPGPPPADDVPALDKDEARREHVVAGAPPRRR